MSTVKISALTPSYNLNANPAQSLFITTNLGANNTYSISGAALGSTLYSNNILNVGQVGITLPNLVAQFTGLSGGYIQINAQNINANGTADYITTADVGNDTNYFIDLGITNSKYSNTSPYNSLGTAIEPLSGYLYVQGNTSTSQSGNLVIGTIQAGTETRFISGGINSGNVITKISVQGITLQNGANLIFSDSTKMNTAPASLTFSQASFNRANSANVLAQASFNQANNALANTSGTFAGDLNITGNTTAQAVSTANLIVNGTTTSNGTTIALGNFTSNGTSNLIGNVIMSGTVNIASTLNVSGIVNMNAQVILTNTAFSNIQSALTITATPSYALPSNDGYMIHISGKQNVVSRIISDSYGANTYVVYAGRTSRGNVSNPSAVQAGDVLTRISGNGYGTTKFQPLGVGRIDFVAAENFTDSNTGSQIQFFNTPVGTNTLTQIATFNASSVTFLGTVQPQKGFIYTPSVYPGAQTAITLDFANNSVVRAQTSSGLVVSLSNYTVGKVVELWVTNTAGTNQTFTHGVSALNSTTNSTTYTIPGTSSILARYMCFDGTLANTLVAVIHA
jgi:hypothetical protein